MKINEVYIAAAGSGKTTHIVNLAINNPHLKVLITTYTIANTDEIKKKFYEINGYVPNNVQILPWFTFLLRHCVRPYQNVLYKRDIKNIMLANGQSTTYVKSTDINNYYFNKNGQIYSDKLSKFAIECNKKTNNAVVNRLQKIYDAIFIDELQDLAGWDLNILELLFASGITIISVGDPRQATLRTNYSRKNKNKSQSNILSYLLEIKDKYSIRIDTQTLIINHRSHKEICDYSNELYSESKWPVTTSDFETGNFEHVGVFMVNEDETDNYLDKYKPIQLRHNKTVIVSDKYRVQTFKKSKGLTYDRVVIYPTKSMLEWIFKKKSLAPSSRCDLYIALTRARYSVGIVIPKDYLNKTCRLKLWCNYV